MNKAESKYFNTALKFDKALLSLLEQKPFEYITISELCEAAGVNRSTFYLHYENTCDLLKEATQYILDSFLSYFTVDKKNITYRFDDCDLQELLFVTPEYLTPYLSFIKENRQIFKTSMQQIGTMDFEGIYQKMFCHIFDPILSRFQFPEKERPYVMKFYLSGITAIVIEWLDHNCADSMEDVTKIISDCVVGKVCLSASPTPPTTPSEMC